MAKRAVLAIMMSVAVGMSASAYAATAGSPLEQWKVGIPADMILCSTGMSLMQYGDGRPVCVSEPTSLVLAERGYVLVRDAADNAGRGEDGTCVPKVVYCYEFGICASKPGTGEPTALYCAGDKCTSELDTCEPSTGEPGTGDDDMSAIPPIPTTVADANNEFAFDLYRQMTADTMQNDFFSPTSIYVAFSVLYEGAKNETAAQMQEAFGFDPDESARSSDIERLMESINRKDPDATLDMFNALWIAQWFNPYPEYVETASTVYDADVQALDLPSEGPASINAWAAEKTRGKITEMVKSLDELTAMVITNAVYFKGTWLVQFNEEETSKEDFWTYPYNTTVSADLMNVRGYFEHTHQDGVQVLKMPYVGDRLSMLVLLPDDRYGLEDLEESISADMVRQWRSDLISKDVIVSMPKFEFRTGYDLVPLLGALGVTDVFSLKRADLSGISPDALDKQLHAYFAKHGAYVKVDEKGTEAAAGTSIGTGIVSLPPVFKADHPFMFIIQDDESGAILFMGRIAEPIT